MNKKKRDLITNFLIIFLIFIAVFGFRYYFFSQSDYFSDDSSYHVLRQAENIVETGKPLFEDNLSYSGRFFSFTPLYHYIIAIFLFFSKSILGLKILNNLFASSIVISAYFLSKNMTKSVLISSIVAILSGFTPIYLQKTLNSLNAFSLFFPLLVLLIFYISKLRRESKKYTSLVVFLFFVLIVLSPLSLILIFGLLFNQILVKVDGSRINKKEVEIFITSFFFYLWYYFLIYKDVFFNKGFGIIKQNIPISIIGDYFIVPTPLEILFLIGIIPFILGSFAVYYISTKEKIPHANILASSIIMIILFSFFGAITINIFIIILGVLMTVISAVGIKFFIDYFIHSKISKLKSVMTLLVILLIFPSIYSCITVGMGVMDDAYTDSNIDVFRWIEQETELNSKIITPVNEGHLLTYFSDRVNIADSNFLMFDNIDQRISDLKKIYTTPFQRDSIDLTFEKYGASYILVDDNVRNIYGIDNLTSYDKTCFSIVYSDNFSNIVYQVIC